MEQLLSSRELQIGDTVRDGHYEWNTKIVKKKDKENITFFRPYGTTANFTYTGGVICYVGIEEYQVPLSDYKDYTLLNRQELR